MASGLTNNTAVPAPCEGGYKSPFLCLQSLDMPESWLFASRFSVLKEGWLKVGYQLRSLSRNSCVRDSYPLLLSV